MAFTTEFVMGAGGAEVQSQAVAWDTTSASNGDTVTVATIPTGKIGDWRIVVVGTESNLTAQSTEARVPALLVNGSAIGIPAMTGNGKTSLSGWSTRVVNTSSVTVRIQINSPITSGRPVFSGVAFWWPE